MPSISSHPRFSLWTHGLRLSFVYDSLSWRWNCPGTRQVKERRAKQKPQTTRERCWNFSSTTVGALSESNFLLKGMNVHGWEFFMWNTAAFYNSWNFKWTHSLFPTLFLSFTHTDTICLSRTYTPFLSLTTTKKKKKWNLESLTTVNLIVICKPVKKMSEMSL